MAGNESARAGKNYDHDDKFHLNGNSNHRKPKITVHYHKFYRLKALPLYPPQNVAPEDGARLQNTTLFTLYSFCTI